MAHENVIAASYPQIIRITLNGKYKVKKSKDIKLLGYFDGKSILEVSCIDGKTYLASLVKVE
jgi:hypothetical protein